MFLLIRPKSTTEYGAIIYALYLIIYEWLSAEPFLIFIFAAHAKLSSAA